MADCKISIGQLLISRTLGVCPARPRAERLARWGGRVAEGGGLL